MHPPTPLPNKRGGGGGKEEEEEEASRCYGKTKHDRCCIFWKEGKKEGRRKCEDKEEEEEEEEEEKGKIQVEGRLFFLLLIKMRFLTASPTAKILAFFKIDLSIMTTLKKKFTTAHFPIRATKWHRMQLCITDVH